MRLLADENFPKSIVDSLREAGHDVDWARTSSPGATDSDLLNLAEAQGRIILTLDKDFWQIALQRKTPLAKGGVVLFRTHPATPERIQRLVRGFTEAGQDWCAHISIVSSDGIRMVSSRRA